MGHQEIGCHKTKQEWDVHKLLSFISDILLSYCCKCWKWLKEHLLQYQMIRVESGKAAQPEVTFYFRL